MTIDGTVGRANIPRMNDAEKPKRTAAATAARMRAREEKAADLLVERGWGVNTPDREDWRDARVRLARERGAPDAMTDAEYEAWREARKARQAGS